VDSLEELGEKLDEVPVSAKHVIIDMADVQYVECGALSILSRFAQARKQAGAEVSFHLSGPVLEAVKRENVGNLFPTGTLS
jgi:anti-anti-sigma regulatory factor